MTGRARPYRRGQFRARPPPPPQPHAQESTSTSRLKPISRMDRLAAISRSGGLEDAGADSLKEFGVQEEFRAYIETQIQAYTTAHGVPRVSVNDLDPTALIPDRETLTNILLLLRKLREGIMASHRVDAFAVEVYEVSARMAIYAQDQTALASILSRLVPDLYDEHDTHVLSTSLAALTTTPFPSPTPAPPPQPPPNRDLHTALYLLHLLLSSPSQHHFLSRSSALLRPPSPHYSLIRAVATHIRRSEFCAFSLLVLSPPPDRPELVQAMLVLLLNRVRGRIWAAQRAAYMHVMSAEADGWLCRVLGFGSSEAVEGFLEERGRRGEVRREGGKWVVVRFAKGKS